MPAEIESHTFDYGDRNPHESPPRKGLIARGFERWEAVIDRAIAGYTRLLGTVLKARWLVIGVAFGLLAAVVVLLGPRLRRDFFPEVDAGAFEGYARAKSGTRIEVTEGYVEAVETYLKQKLGSDMEMVISEIGQVADWSAAFTPNAGPMDAVLKVQMIPDRTRSAQEAVALLHSGFERDPEFRKTLADVHSRRVASGKIPGGTPLYVPSDLEFAFDAGGMIRSAMNEGKSTPLNVRITAKNQEKTHKVAEEILGEVRSINGVVDARILQRLNYPQYVIQIDQSAASNLQLTQMDIRRNIVAAFNSSVQFNKKNFWIDPKSHSQYYVGVQYPEEESASMASFLDIPITGSNQKTPIPLRNVATLTRTVVPSDVVHTNLQPTMDLTMSVQGRDLGHVADEVTRVVAKYGKARPDGGWSVYEPDSNDHSVM